MTEYVSKEALQDKLNRKKAGPATKRYTEGWNDAILMVKSMIHCEKAADVAPVRHGRWILEREPDSKPYCFHCSVCDDDFHYIGITVAYDYCPNCGAKMDLEG